MHKCSAWSHTIEQLTGFSFNQECPLSVCSKALRWGLPSWGLIKTSIWTTAAPKKLLLGVLTCRAHTPLDCQTKVLQCGSNEEMERNRNLMIKVKLIPSGQAATQREHWYTSEKKEKALYGIFNYHNDVFESIKSKSIHKKNKYINNN